MGIGLNDDGKRHWLSVRARYEGQSESTGYGATEVEALRDLLERLEEQLVDLDRARTRVRGMIARRMEAEGGCDGS